MYFMDLAFLMSDDCKIDGIFYDVNEKKFYRIKNFTFEKVLKLDEKFRYSRVDLVEVTQKNKVNVVCTVK